MVFLRNAAGIWAWKGGRLKGVLSHDFVKQKRSHNKLFVRRMTSLLMILIIIFNVLFRENLC